MTPEDQQEHDPLVGTVFADRYLITGRLGKGGMAVVYRATDRNLKRDVAVKVLRKDVAADPVAAKRLVREARAAASLHHPHIITILDVGERNGVVYVVMEVLTGRSLADVLEHDGALSLERALPIAEQLASALVVAHAQGIIHRDIKPENLHLIEHGGTGDFLKVLDFSIAKLPTEMVTAALTRAGSVFGTPHYMAPEQVEGKGVGPQTDLYAVGAVLYEMLTGEPPFDGPSVIDILLKHVKSPPPALSVPGVRLPTGLAELVARLLAKKAADRPASASVLRDELARMAAELPRDGESAQDVSSGSPISTTTQQVQAPAVPMSPVLDFRPPAIVASGPAASGPAAAAMARGGSPAIVPDAAPRSGELLRHHGTIAGKPTVADLPDLPDALPAEPPGGSSEQKRKFAGFGDGDASEQRTMVGAGLGHVVREMARQRQDGSGVPAPSNAAPALPPPPPSHPALLPAEAGHLGVSAPTAVQKIPQEAALVGGRELRSTGPDAAEQPSGDRAAVDRAAVDRAAVDRAAADRAAVDRAAVEAAVPDKAAPLAATAVHRTPAVSGPSNAVDHGRAPTEPMGPIGPGMGAINAGTGRPVAPKPPPPPGALAGHTRRPPPRPPVDDRQPTQPSLPPDAAGLVRQKRHQQDTVVPAQTPAPSPPVGTKKGLWIGLGIAGAVVLAIAAWLIFGS